MPCRYNVVREVDEQHPTTQLIRSPERSVARLLLFNIGFNNASLKEARDFVSDNGINVLCCGSGCKNLDHGCFHDRFHTYNKSKCRSKYFNIGPFNATRNCINLYMKLYSDNSGFSVGIWFKSFH